jgi:hypothetical protein
MTFAATTASITTLNADVNADSANFITLNTTNAEGTNATFDDLAVTNFAGGSFTGDDFDTSQSSVNDNYAMLSEYGEAIDDCINVSQYCIPQTPVVTISCDDCTDTGAKSSFSATLSIYVTQCRQGCDVASVIPSALTKSSGCTTTTISAGGSATLSCTVSLTLDPQEAYEGSITVTATNSHYTSESYTATQAIYFENTTTAEPEVNTSCSGCIQQSDKEDFSATITGSVYCPYACTYTWTETGGASKDSCSGGSVSSGETNTVTCEISASLDAQESVSGTVKLTATLTADSSYTDNDSESYSWENTSSGGFDWSAVKAGCELSTEGEIEENSCSDFFVAQYDEMAITFVLANSDDWSFDDGGYEAAIKWSGDCVGTSNTCTIEGLSYRIGSYYYTATVTVTIDGESYTYTVKASYEINT